MNTARQLEAVDITRRETVPERHATIEYAVVRRISAEKGRFWAYVERTITVGGQQYEMSTDDSNIAGKIIHLEQADEMPENNEVPMIPLGIIGSLQAAITDDLALVTRRLRKDLPEEESTAPSLEESPPQHAPQVQGSRHRVPA